MGNWNSISAEIAAINSPEQYDIVRRQKIAALKEITGRDLVLFAVDWIAPNPLKAQVAGPLTSISLADKDGFDEVTRNLPGPDLDVVLHSPGGSAEAAESIVELLRARFRHIRFVIPNVAKSAATIMAMAGDQLVMDERSELGPTDPQMFMIRDQQQLVAPAQAIKDQFQQAQDQINADPNRLPAWVPLLQQYGPSLLAQCDNLIQLSEDLVTKWLTQYMFAGQEDAATKAKQVAGYLSNHNNFQSHGRRVGITDLQKLGVNILDMRTEPRLRDAVWDVYTATMISFSGTGAFSIFENSNNEALVRVMHLEIAPQLPPVPAPEPAAIPPTAPNRKQQRQRGRGR